MTDFGQHVFDQRGSSVAAGRNRSRLANLSYVLATLTTGLAVVALLVLADSSVNARESAMPKNVVVIMIDTLRSDHLASYGYSEQTTPFLSRLSVEGIQLQGYSSSSWTRPSVATLLTGLQPQRHQAISRSDALPRTVPFLPELLHKSGFATAAVVTNGNVGRQVGFGRGYDSFFEFEPKGKPDGNLVTTKTLDAARKLAPPFFLYVHYIDPHDPYYPEKAWKMDDVPRDSYVQPNDFLQRALAFSGIEMKKLRAQYDGEIHEMDDDIESLFRGLRDLQLTTDTLFVITADHGEEFGEHQGVAHGRHLHEEVIRVPFLLWMESNLPSYRSSAPFHHVDFLPTVLDALGLAPPPGIDGTSRWQALLNSQMPVSENYFFHLDLEDRAELALLKYPIKLIHKIDDAGELLFNLEEDRYEARPMQTSKEQPVLTRALIQHHNTLSKRSYERSTVSIEGGLREQLEALGYVDSQATQSSLSQRIIPPILD